ncbi:MAG: extracellular solute-binding protein [Clostridiales bacterium]|nr:MAG: extracellular solute-binding protein [Clostridiales bacterium]
MEGYPEELCAGFKINGKTYSLPFSAATRGLVYNKDMFKAAGIVDEKRRGKTACYVGGIG